ncbi:MAG: hypothetical protein HQK66_05550 [Desulfamplus sp.]|nr:hypothetical protein [Desulfamplus sp.]
MNENIIKEVFSVYEVLKDSVKVARRSINKEMFTLHNRTIFWAEQKELILGKLTDTEEELDDIMVLSLFASFERELRVFIQNIINGSINTRTKTLERIISLTTDSIERWTMNDMVEAFSDIVDGELRGRVKQIYEYRNWIAHGKNPNRLPSARTDPKTVNISLVDFILQAKQATSASI